MRIIWLNQLQEFHWGDNNNKSEKKKIDEEKKEFRISKAIQKIKKKQGGEGNSASQLNKSLKITDMDKELENKIQKKSETFVEEEKNNNDIEDNNVVNVLNN